MERSGLHDQKNPAIVAQSQSAHRSGGKPYVKFLSCKYREHGLAVEEVDRPNRPRQDVARGDAFGILRRDDNVVGADAKLQLFYPNRTAQR